MEPTFDIPPDLLANETSFSDSFFSFLSLRPAARPLSFGGKTKDYLFPTLYGNVRCAVGIFHCSRDAAKRLAEETLGTRAEPPRMPGGRSIVAISCYEYRNVRGVRPYNEIAVALPVRLDGKAGLPVLGAFKGGPDSGYFIASMPVTSEENRLRGKHFWNLPKTTRRIDIEVTGSRECAVTSFDEDGKTVDIALTIPTEGKRKEFDVKSFLVTNLEGKVTRSVTAFHGSFAVNARVATIFGARSGNPVLTLGTGSASKILSGIDVDPWPLQTRFSDSVNSYFDLPDGAKRG